MGIRFLWIPIFCFLFGYSILQDWKNMVTLCCVMLIKNYSYAVFFDNRPCV